jgi:hypothetical protein
MLLATMSEMFRSGRRRARRRPDGVLHQPVVFCEDADAAPTAGIARGADVGLPSPRDLR